MVYASSSASLCLPLLQLENFICKCTQRELSQEMESGWERERRVGGKWARHVHSACGSRWAEGGKQAAAINHIHSLPVERAFNLHAELHIAYGRCLPAFARSVVGWFSLDRVRVGDGGGLETYKVFNFKCLINLYNRIKISSTKAPLRTVGWNYCAHKENNYENNLNYACCLLCVCIN